MDAYADPARYEAAMRAYESDIPFYRSLAERATGTVVDLCCGTGRLTLPVAEVATRVIGIDHSPAMLAVARARGGVGVEWVLADCRKFSLGEKADLIFCGFNSFQHFLNGESQRAVLECVREHLRPGGIFALDVPNPTDAFLRRYEASPFRNLKGWAKRRLGAWVPGGLGHQVGHYDRKRSMVKMDWFRFGTQTRHTRMRCRWFTPEELDALFGSAGFQVEARYGGFAGEPFGRGSLVQVIICRARGPVGGLGG